MMCINRDIAKDLLNAIIKKMLIYQIYEIFNLTLYEIALNMTILHSIYIYQYWQESISTSSITITF